MCFIINIFVCSLQTCKAFVQNGASQSVHIYKEQIYSSYFNPVIRKKTTVQWERQGGSIDGLVW